MKVSLPEGRHQNSVWFALLLSFPLSAVGQGLSGAAAPGQIEKRFEQAPSALSSGGVVAVPGSNGSVSAPTGAGEIRFTLTRIEVEGATVFSAAELQEQRADMLGSPSSGLPESSADVR